MNIWLKAMACTAIELGKPQKKVQGGWGKALMAGPLKKNFFLRLPIVHLLQSSLLLTHSVCLSAPSPQFKTRLIMLISIMLNPVVLESRKWIQFSKGRIRFLFKIRIQIRATLTLIPIPVTLMKHRNMYFFFS